MSRQTVTATDAIVAECQACPWRNTAANALGTAAIHHDATGHTITTTIQRTITYGDPAGAQLAGQTRLDIEEHQP